MGGWEHIAPFSVNIRDDLYFIKFVAIAASHQHNDRAKMKWSNNNSNSNKKNGCEHLENNALIERTKIFLVQSYLSICMCDVYVVE